MSDWNSTETTPEDKQDIKFEKDGTTYEGVYLDASKRVAIAPNHAFHVNFRDIDRWMTG